MNSIRGRHSAVMSIQDTDEHARLAAEIPTVQRLPIGERLLLARRRRLDQVSRYERWLSRHQANGLATATRRRRTLSFAGAVSLLEAVRRDDLSEG